MKHILFVLLLLTYGTLISQASTGNPISPAYQNMPKDVPVLLEYDWLFNTTALPECKPLENELKDGQKEMKDQQLVSQPVKAYPNPNSVCMLTVDFQVTVPGSRLLLSALDGSLLYSEDLGEFTGQYTRQLDLSVAPSTVVILTVIQNGVPSSKKIIVD